MESTASRRGRTELVLFFVLTLCAWAIWVPQARYRLGLAESAVSLRSPTNALTVWSPGLAAILVTAVWLRAAGVRALLRRLTMWRVRGWCYAVALLFEPARWLLSLGIDRLLGRAYELGPMPLTAILGPAPAFMIGVVVVFTVPNAIGEEIGWRGFALPRLGARFGLLAGTLLLGAWWGLWHIPAWIGQGLDTGAGPTAIRVLGLMAIAFVFTWLFEGAGGSLLPVVLFHASIASKNYVLPGLPTLTDDVVLCVFVLALVVSTRRRWFGHVVPDAGARRARIA